MTQIILSGPYITQYGYRDSVAYQMYDATFYYKEDPKKEIFREYDVVIDDADGGNVQFGERLLVSTAGYAETDPSGTVIGRRDTPQPIVGGSSKDPADLKAEFDYILERQKAILEDLKGVAAAVEKTEKNSALAKNISNAVSVVAGAVITVASVGTAAPLIPLAVKGTGAFFTLRANNKLKKYYARVDELTIEYNNNNKRLLELDKILNPKKPIVTAGDTGGNKLKLTTPQIAVIGLAVVIIVVLLWRYYRK
jgi:hypothetical protein